MWWKLLWAFSSIFVSPFRGPGYPDRPFEATPYGPQSWEEEFRARQALQGEYDDIRYPEEGDEPSYAGINDTSYRWPGYPGAGRIPYKFSPEIQKDKKMVDLFNKAIKQYHDNTCIRFVPRTNDINYIYIIKDPGRCYSWAGRQVLMRPQNVSLDDGCGFIGTVVHELGHAIGLFHEHQRTDRDQYITIYENNIEPKLIHNFNMTKPKDELKWAKYDYTSIMHYGEYAFSSQPGVLKTMVAKDGKTKLKEPYDRPGLNQNDIDLVKKLYKCK